MKQELLAGALLAALMIIPVMGFAEGIDDQAYAPINVQLSPDKQLAQNQVQAPTTGNNASDHPLIQGTSANGSKETTIVDENGNLKIVEKNTLPKASSAQPATTSHMQPSPMPPLGQSSNASPMRSTPAVPMQENPTPTMSQPGAGAAPPNPMSPDVPMQQQNPTPIQNKSLPMTAPIQPIQGSSIPMNVNPPPSQPSSVSTQQNSMPGQPGSTAIAPASPSNQ